MVEIKPTNPIFYFLIHQQQHFFQYAESGHRLLSGHSLMSDLNFDIQSKHVLFLFRGPVFEINHKHKHKRININTQAHTVEMLPSLICFENVMISILCYIKPYSQRLIY